MVIGAKALIIYEGKILSILRDNKPDIHWPNTWDLPGGGIEKGETLNECMLREIEEEVGICPKNIMFLGVEKNDQDEDMGRYLIFLTKGEAEQIKLGDEGQKVKFLTLEEVEKVSFVPHLRKFVIEVMKKMPLVP